MAEELAEEILEGNAVSSPFPIVQPKFPKPFPTDKPTKLSAGSTVLVSSPALSPAAVAPEVPVKTPVVPPFTPPAMPSKDLGLTGDEDKMTQQDIDGNEEDEPKKTQQDIDKEKMEEQLENISARTMYNMVSQVLDAKGGQPKKLVFFTNAQAKLFDGTNIHKILDVLELPTPKLVIRFMAIGGGPNQRKYGMISAFKKCPRTEEYNEKWRECLEIQAQNNPSTQKDMMPDAPFLSASLEKEAHWQLDSFFRDVLVPLAAKNKALIIGSAFRDDEMMMGFARAASQVLDKYSTAEGVPWSLIAIAEAPKLIKASQDTSSVTHQWFKCSENWQKRIDKIRKAKKKEEAKKRPASAGARDQLSSDDLYIQFDLNPDLDVLIVVDQVSEKGGKIVGLDPGPQNAMRMELMDFLSDKHPLIAVGSLHALGGYRGIEFTASWLNLNIPVLMLDVRNQQERPGFDFLYRNPLDEREAEEFLQKLTDRGIGPSQDDVRDGLKPPELCALALFERLRMNDDAYSKKLFDPTQMVDGAKDVASRPKLVDIYEICRLAYFHANLLAKKPAKLANCNLYERIEHEKMLTLAAQESVEAKFNQKLVDKIADWCTIAEFRAMWELLTQKQKGKLYARGIDGFKQYYADEMKQARFAYHSVLSSKFFFTAHVQDVEELKFLVNNRMMDTSPLPEKNTLEALIVLRQAWDLADVGRYVLARYKFLAKALYISLIILAVAIVAITVQSSDLDVEGNAYKGKKLSELLVFVLSLLTSFITAYMAFMNPVVRWKQIRDAVATMESAIWMFRTRTAEYAHKTGKEAVSSNALKDKILECRASIMSAADVLSTSFEKIYPPKIFLHDQRQPEPNLQTAKVSPAASGTSGTSVTAEKNKYPLIWSQNEELAATEEEGGKKEKVIIDLEDTDSVKECVPDDHHSPVKPDDYIRLRLYPMMEFYRDRVPKYSRSKQIYSVLLIVGASTGAVLAFIGYGAQVAIITAITSGITAWNEFDSTASKISRYSMSIVAIENLCSWWDHLDLVSKASPTNIGHLVMTGEGIINSERSAWLSAPPKKGEDEGDDAAEDGKD